MKTQAGLRLKCARLAWGVQRSDVMAHALGVTPTAYSNWENGERLPDPAAMVRLLELTGIGPDWIYGGSTRGLPYDMTESLLTCASEISAVVGGAAPEWPAAVSQRDRGRPAAAAPPKPSRRVLHETAATFDERQVPQSVE